MTKEEQLAALEAAVAAALDKHVAPLLTRAVELAEGLKAQNDALIRVVASLTAQALEREGSGGH